MKMIKVGLDGLSALEKVAKALFIETKLTGNPHFPAAAPFIAMLTAARLALESAIAAALHGGTDNTFAKNEAEDAMDEAIVQTAGHVQSVAGGNEAMILSAGFDVRKPSAPMGPLPKVGNLRADLTDKIGEILADWDSERGAREYELQRNSGDPVDEAAWKTIAFTTKSKHTDSGLPTGTKHWYRVRLMGTGGIGPWSDPAQAMCR